MPEYTLVNPAIMGDFNRKISAHNETDASHEAWKDIAKYITGELPAFAFTLENDQGKMLNFRVTEKPHKKYADFTITRMEGDLTERQAEALRREIKNLEAAQLDYADSMAATNNVNSSGLMGGKRRWRYMGREKEDKEGKESKEDAKTRNRYDNDDSDSSDSSSSESESEDDEDFIYEKLKKLKMANNAKMYGKPIVYWWYTPTLYRLDRFYMPTLCAPLTPYVEINLSSAFLG